MNNTERGYNPAWQKLRARQLRDRILKSAEGIKAAEKSKRKAAARRLVLGSCGCNLD